MKMKPLYMTAVGAVFAGLFAVAPVGPAGAAKASFTPNPHHLNCGAQALTVGEVCGTVTFTNNTAAPVTVAEVDVVGDVTDFGAGSAGVTNPCQALPTLAPGASCGVSVVFNPSEIGHRSAKLVVSEANRFAPATVGLGGRGVDI
jgi:hypothetical protein